MTNNPLARLRAINVEKQREEEAEANATAEEALPAYSNDAMSTYSNEYVSKGVSKDASDGGRAEASTDARKGRGASSNTSSSAPMRKGAKGGVLLPVPEAAPAPAYASVKERVSLPANKQMTTRLNLEMPDDLHEWLKMYCLKNKTTLRVLICTLAEDFKQHEEAGE